MSDRREGERTLRCEEVRVLLMGYLDGELEAAAVRRVDDHLAVCVSCRREERAFRDLGQLAEESLDEEVRLSTTEAWESIYGRIERRVGWVLLWIGILLLSAYGLWHFVGDFLLDGEAPVAVRLGVGALVGGGLVLLVSFLRETLAKYGSERYREVQR